MASSTWAFLGDSFASRTDVGELRITRSLREIYTCTEVCLCVHFHGFLFLIRLGVDTLEIVFGRDKNFIRSLPLFIFLFSFCLFFLSPFVSIGRGMKGR